VSCRFRVGSWSRLRCFNRRAIQLHIRRQRIDIPWVPEKSKTELITGRNIRVPRGIPNGVTTGHMGDELGIPDLSDIVRPIECHRPALDIVVSVVDKRGVGIEATAPVIDDHHLKSTVGDRRWSGRWRWSG